MVADLEGLPGCHAPEGERGKHLRSAKSRDDKTSMAKTRAVGSAREVGPYFGFRVAKHDARELAGGFECCGSLRGTLEAVTVSETLHGRSMTVRATLIGQALALYNANEFM